MYLCLSLVTKSFRLLVVASILLTGVLMPMSAPVRAAPSSTADQKAQHSSTVFLPEPSGRDASARDVRLSASHSLLPAPEPGDERQSMRLYAIVDPAVVEPGAEAVCTVTVVNESVQDLEELTLSASLPTGLSLAEEESPIREWRFTIAHLAMGETTQVELPLKVNQDATGPLVFAIELHDADGQLRATTTAIVGVMRGTAQQVTPAGGRFISEDGRLRVDFPPDALQATAEVTAHVQTQQIAPWGRSDWDQSGAVRREGILLHFTLEARDSQTGQVVEMFERPVTLTVDLRGLVDRDGLPAGSHFYLIHLTDSETGQAKEVPAEFDPRTGTLTAQVNHFSDWEIGTVGEGWKPLFTLPVPDLFSGAATYDYPIKVPPGRNGLQPGINLSYNSRRVDGLIDGFGGTTDGGPIALGWSVGGTVEIARRHEYWWDGAHSRLKLYGDFSLVINGATYELEPDGDGPCGRYRARHAPELYVERRNAGCGEGSGSNRTTDYWIVRQPDGTEFRLGYTDNSEVWIEQHYNLLMCRDDYCSPDDDTFGAIRWRADTVTDTTGNRMAFTYREKEIEGGYETDVQRSILLEIRYNNYGSDQWMSKVSFVPVSNDQDDEDYMRIKRIDVWNAGERIRQYKLDTDKKWWNACGQNHSEWALLEIQEFSGDGSASLPPVSFRHVGLQNYKGGTGGVGCFTYRRVSEVYNGYGGRTEFSYVKDGRCVGGCWPDPGCLPEYGYSYHVSETRTYDGIHQNFARVTYDYGTRCYDQNSGNTNGGALCRGRNPSEYGPLVGHDWVTVRKFDYDGTLLNKTTHRYYIDDHHSWRRGHEYQIQTRSGQGELLRQTDTTWGSTANGSTLFAHVDQVVTTDYSGGDSANKKVEYEYDSYGNVTTQYERGSTAVSGDERTTHRQYRPNTTDWIVNKVARKSVYEGIHEEDPDHWDSDLKSRTLYRYDNQSSWDTPPQDKGELTAVDRWNGENWMGYLLYDTTTYDYDQWGNRTSETDPRGNITTIDYDDAYDLFPITTCSAVGTDVEQCSTTEYYGVNDAACVDNGYYFGKVCRKYGPNGPDTATRYTYDVFGRLTKEIRPGDSPAIPTTSYDYDHSIINGERVFFDDFEDNCSPGSCPQGWSTWYVSAECQSGSAYEGAWGVNLRGPESSSNDGALFTDQTPELLPDSPYLAGLVFKGAGTITVNLSDDADEWYHAFTAAASSSWRAAEGIFVTGESPGNPRLHIWAELPEDSVDVDLDNVEIRRRVGLRVIETRREESGCSGCNQPIVRFYDGLGRLIQARKETENGSLQSVTNYTYDALGRRAREYIPVEESFSWDFNRPSGWDARPHTTTQYDALGRVSVVTAPDGTQTNHYYTLDTDENVGIPPSDLTGLWVHATKDANGHAKHYVHDALGRLIVVRDFNGTCYPGDGCSDPYTLYAATTYNYDVLDNLIQVTDAAGNQTTMTYDPLGRKTEMDDPDMGHWTYDYDPAGNLVRQTDARSQRVCFYYDELNRLKGKTYSSGSGSCPGDPGYSGYAVKYRYDEDGHGYGKGQRTSMSNDADTTSWTYDKRGRMTEETKSITGAGTFETEYTYDAMDRVVDMTYPDGEVVHHDYNPQGLLESVDGYDTYVEQMDYNALEQMELQELGNGLDVDYQYYSASEDNNRLQRIQIPNRLNLEYTYDDVGNVWSITDGENGGQAQHFRYDALDRLTEAWTSGGGEGNYDETYGYDEIGNVTLKNGFSYWYESSQPHAVQALLAGSYAVAEYSYDANGNMTARDENSTEYTQAFDAENRLKSVTTGGETTTFTYDGDGNLVKKEDGSGTTVYVGDYYEVQGGTVIKYYFAGGKQVAMRKGGVVYYLHGDHLGSTSLTTDSGGGVVAEQLYYPYGETRWSDGTLPTDYHFTDQRHETDLGLYDYNARYYDPYLGRFIQADTIVPEPGNPQDLNRYAYVRNSPLNFTDPSGHAVCVDEGCNYVLHPVSGDIILRGSAPPNYNFTAEQWQAVETWSDYFGLPDEFTGAVVAAEVLYDTDWYDRPMDKAIGSIAALGILANSSSKFHQYSWAEAFLERSQSGLPLLGGLTFGPGIGQVHAATAMQAEQHFGEDFPIQPETASMRHLLLVQDETNIMYVAAILRMYADQRPGSRDASGQMTVDEMGAVFANFHEDVRTAFRSQRAYKEGVPPTISGQHWVDQLRPLVWYYRAYGR